MNIYSFPLTDEASLFLAFIIYSFIGWFYESNIWAVIELKHFTNRGFLIGPVCPIYGIISLLDCYFLGNIKNPIAIFVIAMVVCCFFEYITSYLLEKIFKRRWWDYSNYPFNFQGRISLFSGLLFGAAGLLLLKVVHPIVSRALYVLSPVYLEKIATLLLIIFLGDLVFSTIGLSNKIGKVSNMYIQISDLSNEPFIYLTQRTKYFRDSAAHTIHTRYTTLKNMTEQKQKDDDNR